ncbi:MAG: hypothetical protein ACR2NL_05635 [Acidimicrobiia bacterium]
MPLKAEEPLEKVTFNAFETDYAWLKRFYRKTGPQRALRLLLRKHRRQVESRAEARRQDDGDELSIDRVESSDPERPDGEGPG